MATDQFGAPNEFIKTVYEFTPEALEQVAQYLETRGLRTPISNLVGYAQLTPQSLYLSGAPLGTTTSLTAVDVPGGPISLTLRGGTYIMFVGGRVKMDVNTNTGTMGITANSLDIAGTGATDARRFLFNNTDPVTQLVAFPEVLKGDQTVTLRCLVSGGTATFYEAYLTALKIGT